MSEVVDAIVVNGEILVCVDFDRPIWQNIKFKELKCLPNYNHFVVDGILGALSPEGLKKIRIENRFNNFDNPTKELESARLSTYGNLDLALNYIHYDSGERIIHEDLAKFAATIEVTQLSQLDFERFVKQEN